MPLQEIPGDTQPSLAQSLVGFLLLSPGSWWEQGFKNAELEVNPTPPRGCGLLSPLEPECAFLSEGPLEADVCPKREGQKQILFVKREILL